VTTEDQPKEQAGGKAEDIPRFRISPKKVDDSWKEEARREREQPVPAAPPRVAPAAAQPTPAAGKAPSKEAPQKQPQAPKASAADEQQSKIFMTFLAGLAQQTLMQLGEIESPFSGQRELDLNGARYTIELLAVLQKKTQGNLTTEEAAAITEAIHDLKMRYVEIANEVQRQMAAQVQKGAAGKRPGPGGTIPGPGFGKRG
jgi:hypothetical protein